MCIEHRPCAVGRGDDEPCAVERRGGIPDRTDNWRRTRIVIGNQRCRVFRQPGGQALGAGARPRHDPHLEQPACPREQLDVRSPLGSRTEHRQDIDVSGRQKLRSQRAAGGGADLGQRCSVEQGTCTARFGIQQEDGTLDGGFAPRRIVRKHRHHLGAERRQSGKHGGHDQHEPAGTLEVAANRHRGRAARQLAECDTHRVHRVPRGERAPYVARGKDPDLHVS